MYMERFPDATTDELERVLAASEAAIARHRALQVAVLSDLDVRQVAHLDGSRSMTEWVAARIDVTPETASALIQTARRLADHKELAAELNAGHVSFDRAVEESRLAQAGADRVVLAAARGRDLAGVRRMAARHRRMTKTGEQEIFRDRCLAIQPTLDDTAWRIWARLPGYEGRIVEEALSKRAEQFPASPDGKRGSRTERNADALVSIAQDSLDGDLPEGERGSGPLVSIFVDAGLAAATRGEAGAGIAAGPRVGPLTLQQILCDGRVEVLTTDLAGIPLALGPAARTIPPKLRRWVLHRDGGCVADGCRSRYRLQPHHITPRAAGGDHHPDNLASLCWFHHHVVVHRMGYLIDPHSPPQRRRFLRPDAPDPP